MIQKTARQKTRQTGNEFQNWCEKELKKQGYLVHNQKTVSKMMKVKDYKTGELKDIWVSQRNDIFGAFDIVAIKKGSFVTFIQCTTHKSVTEKMKQISIVFDFLDPGMAEIQVWQKIESGRVVIWRYDFRNNKLTRFAEVQRGKWLYNKEKA